MSEDKNITPEADSVEWNSADPCKSLEAIRQKVDTEAKKAIEWYWKGKRSKQLASKAIQSGALLLTAAGGLAPLALRMLVGDTAGWKVDTGILASILVGSAATLVGLDKAFGYSSGWTRYVLTATNMTTRLHEFRFDWIALKAASENPPTGEQQRAMIQRAREFVVAIQAIVEQETKDWATEFQASLSRTESGLKAEMEALKIRIDKEAKEREATTQPGAIELNVTNAGSTDDFSYNVELEGPKGKLQSKQTGAMVWTQRDVVPGQYSVIVRAKLQGRELGTAAIIVVKPGQVEKVSLTLPSEGASRTAGA